MNYKDPEALREESEEGRRLGFDGKVGFPFLPIGAVRQRTSSLGIDHNDIHDRN